MPGPLLSDEQVLGQYAAPSGLLTDEQVMASAPAAAAKSAPKVGYVTNLIRQAANAASFGTADEGQAFIQGLWDKRPYEERLAEQRAIDKKFSDESPYSAAGAQLAGGVAGVMAGGEALGAMGMGAKAATATPSLLSSTLKAGAAGAAAGGAAGFGSGENGFQNRMESAAVGAVGGGLLGLAAPPILAAAGTAAAPVIDRFRDPAGVAGRKVIDRLAQDGFTPDQAIEKLRGLGPTAVLADVGENTTGLARAVANVPGEGRTLATDTLTARQAGRAGRIMQGVREGIGAPTDFHATMDALDATRKAAAAPLYEKAYQASPVLTEDTQALFARPSMKGAMNKAFRIAAEEGRDPTTLGLGMNQAGDVTFTRQPSMQTLDYVKRGIDDVLEAYRDSTTGKLRLDTEGRAVNATRADFVSALKKMNPDYEAALNAYSGPSQSLDAMHMGRRFIRNDPEVTAKVLDGMSDGDKQFFRAGAMRAIQDMIQNDTNAAARKFGNNKDAFWSKLQNVFPDAGSFTKFRQSVQQEIHQTKLENAALAGSRTAPLARDIQDLEQTPSPIMQFGMEAAKNGVRGALMKSAIEKGAAVADRLRLPSEAIAERAGGLLYAPADDAAAQLRSLLNRPLPMASYASRSKQLGGLLGLNTGLLAGN